MAHPRILVTGAYGNLGKDLTDQLRLIPQYDVIGTGSDDLNLAWTGDAIRTVLDTLHPQIIINTAAFTDVDGAEDNRAAAFQINAKGPQVLAEWAAEHGAYLIHISTDYVFDGCKGIAYTPSDSPHPINAYGESKYAGEQAILTCLPSNAAIIRTSWLFGSGQKNFVPFLLRSAQSQTPIRVVEDQWGTPTWTGNLNTMILDALKNRMTGVFHGCSHGIVTRYEQALFIYDCLGVSTDLLTAVSADTFPFKAKRPVNTAMIPSFDSALEWKEATCHFLETQPVIKSHV